MKPPVVLEVPPRRWHCPACLHEDVTREARPHSRMHDCPAMGGLSVPMLPAGARARLVAHEREDYVGAERVRLDNNGRPVMQVVTEHADGRVDATVYAPTAARGYA
jgi:hypothetical protein